MKAGDKVLEIGCGKGRVAAHFASAATGAHVTGINIDPIQLKSARNFAQKRNVRILCFFKRRYERLSPVFCWQLFRLCL